MAGFGVFGYLLRKLSCEMAPLLLGFILGPMMEEYLSRSSLLSQNDFSVFVSRPLSLRMLLLAVALLVVVLAPSIRRKRETTFQEAG